MTGIALALGACVLWSLSPFFFTATGRRIGAYATNLIRLTASTLVLAALCAADAVLRPGGASPAMGEWVLFVLSGVLGLAVGDHFLYRSLSEVGPERTSLVMTLSPAIAAAMAWVFLRETLAPAQLAGMTLVLGGVAAATWPKKGFEGAGTRWIDASNGILSALCQGGSTVLAREAFLRQPALSPIFATAIRIASGAAALVLLGWAGGRLGGALRKAGHPGMPWRLVLGTLTGPIVGMLFFISALKYQSAGVVTTITFMTPLLILPLGAWRYHTRLGGRVLLGGAAALGGLTLLGWNP